MTPNTDSTGRWQVYALIITLAAGLASGRILSAERLNEPSVHRAGNDRVTPRPAWPDKRPLPTPLYSSNDRSRWALVCALVDEGTFVIGKRNRVVVECSGPTVLAANDPLSAAVLLEAGYQMRIAKSNNTGVIFDDGWESVDKVLHPATMEFYSTKPPLVGVLVAGEYWLLQKLFGWTLKKDTFTVVRVVLFTINVLPLVLYLWLLASLVERFAMSDWAKYFVLAAGAFGTLVTPFLVTFNNHTIATTTGLLAVWAVVRILEDDRPWLFAIAGLAAAFTACNELPATSLACGLFVFLLYRKPRQTLLYFVPAALLVVGSLLLLNYLQLGRLRPAYAEFGGPWYEYEGSHWRVPADVKKRGIDFAGRNGETKVAYAFHLLFGHHGLFSLTPIFLLAFVSMAIRPQNQSEGTTPAAPVRLVTLFTLLLSVVVIGFYIVKSDNYGGWSNGPRWLMWLSPLWLLSMVPLLDVLAKRRWGRVLALVLLGWSIMSMNYQNWNAWRHPWTYNWMESRGWIDY